MLAKFSTVEEKVAQSWTCSPSNMWPCGQQKKESKMGCHLPWNKLKAFLVEAVWMVGLDQSTFWSGFSQKGHWLYNA